MKKSKVLNLSEIVGQRKPKETQREPELVFTQNIDAETGGKRIPLMNPSRWSNVVHIRGNLYLAYGDDLSGNPSECEVYVGEYR